MNNKALGKKIRELRHEKGWSLDKMSDVLGVNKSTLQRYEMGTTQKISVNNLRIIAKTLGVSINSLIGKQGDLPDEDMIEIKAEAWDKLQETIQHSGSLLRGLSRTNTENKDTTITYGVLIWVQSVMEEIIADLQADVVQMGDENE